MNIFFIHERSKPSVLKSIESAECCNPLHNQTSLIGKAKQMPGFTNSICKMLKNINKHRRKITSVEDLTPEEQIAVLKSINHVPCVPFTLNFLNKYEKMIDVDFSKIKKEDMDRMYLLTLEQIKLIMMHDYDALRGLCLIIQSKSIYRKAWESFVIDKDHMDMNLDEFRARCQAEHEDTKTIEPKIKEKNTEGDN